MFGSGSGEFSGGNTSGFGQSAFGKLATPAVFGQANTSLFNQTTQPNTGLFGATATAPTFGQTPTAQPTFGGFNTGGTSLFGTPAVTTGPSGGLFDQKNASTVGNTGGGLFGVSNPNISFGQAKPIGSGFSFEAPAVQPTGNIFGTPQTSTANTGMFGASTAGTFGATSEFGATSTGGTSIKFNSVTGTDTMARNGVNQTIHNRHPSITVMKEYESKIFEELRLEDYCANRKVGQQGAVGNGLFGTNFNKQLFGTASTTPALGGFGNPTTSNVFSTQNSIFGKPQETTPAFGTQTSNQSFRMNITQPSIFGSNTAQISKPFGDTVILDNQETSIYPSALEEDHPTEIKLKRVGYYTIPPLNELVEILDDNGLCIVDGFTIGRYDYGNVYFPDRFNVSGLDLDSIVHIRHREIIIYQDDETKPPLGKGLNRKATVTLDCVWPNDKTSKEPITNPDFVAKLQRACVKLGTQFIDYRPDTGSWVFNVEHFSKYALIDSDDDEEEKVVNIVGLDVGPKNITKTVIQKSKVITKQTEIVSPKQNVIKPLLDLSMGLDRAQSPHQYLLKSNIQLATVNPSASDSHIMHYYDGKENSVNVTAQLSQNMNLQTQKIQCMKASFDDIFYDEIEPMELDDGTYGQKDKFEDKLEKILETIPEYIISVCPKNRDTSSKSKALITPIDNQGSPKLFISKQKKKVQAVEVLKPVLTAPLQAQRFSLKYSPNIRLPFELKLKNSCNFSKLALINTSSFKVPWSNNLTFITLNTKSKERFLPSKSLDISYLSTELSGRGKDDCSPTIVQKIQIVTPNKTETFIELLTEHLQICMLNSNCETESKNIPYFYPKSGVEALHSHCSLVAHFFEVSEEERYAHVWELIKALWGDSETANVTDSPQEHSYNMARRQGVSDWLEALLEKPIDSNTNENTSRKILNLVSVHKIMEACDLAISSNECNLAMLLAQLESENSIRCCIQRQLLQWFSSKADLFIDIDHLKLYTMISGKPVFNSNQGIINICENLDWIRAFALHLWYIQPPSGTIKDALDCYENAYESEDFYACKPYKTYNNDSVVDIDDQFATYDVCYHLLKLYTNSSYEIYKIVNPLTHTPDPLDFNFSWLLYNTLQSLGYIQMPEIYASQLHSNFAAQLVSHGLWQWAVFILLHINDEELRENLIEDIVGRNVELPVCNNYEIVLSEKEIFVLNKLKINEGIIYNAKAILAMTKYKYLEATICYLKAENWQDAHNAVVSHLLADFILHKDGKITLKYLLDWLIEGSKVGGSLPTTVLDSLTLLEYLKLNNTINKMSAEISMSYISSLCERVACFSENTSEERMIKTEASSSIALQLGQLISKLDAENYKILKSLLSTLYSKLTLAEDYVLDELVLAISHYI